MLPYLIATLALAVAVLYCLIGLYVVPRLAAVADRTTGLIRVAQYGAAAFFAGCALLHVAIAEHTLAVPELVRGREWAYILPQLAEAIGGAVFAAIVWAKLDVRLRTREEARQEAKGARLHEQSQRLGSLGELAGDIAHEFNDLLAVILGSGRTLDHRLAERPDLRDEAARIVAAAERGAELTRQMLMFSPGGADDDTSDVRRAIEGSERLLRRAAGERVEVRLEPAPELPPVGLSRGRIEQILLNLTLNARDAMPDGGTLTVRTEPAGGERMRLIVEDTGEGMPADVAAHAFDPFFTTKDDGVGTGLGLSVVYGIVERSGGSIGIDSVPGEGTRFTIEMPAVPAAAAEEPPASPDAGSLHGVTILVADDEESVRVLMARILEQHDARVIEAANGRQAMEILRAHNRTVDLVLTDILMPEMSGLELARRLRDERPAMPLVYVSGYTGEDFEQPDDGPLVAKPFTSDGLVRAVADALPARLLAGR